MSQLSANQIPLFLTLEGFQLEVGLKWPSLPFSFCFVFLPSIENDQRCRTRKTEIPLTAHVLSLMTRSVAVSCSLMIDQSVGFIFEIKRCVFMLLILNPSVCEGAF